ncbi:MAG: SMC-Scp complex subunit ScpB [Beijerinckiaceae bacterium]
MVRPKPLNNADALFDRELADLPPEARWREWMNRVEGAIFASQAIKPREVLAELIGKDVVLDELIADIRDELKARPYDLVPIAGGWQHRTRPRFAQAIRQARGERKSDEPEAAPLSQTESLVVAAIAYHQPITRERVSHMLGREISRDTVARLKRLGLLGAGPRMPQVGAPLTYVTTPAFLERFGLNSLRDLPEIEAVESMSPIDVPQGLPDELLIADEESEAEDLLETDEA